MPAPDHSLGIEISPDELQVLLTCTWPEGDATALVDEIRRELAHRGVCYSLPPADVARLEHVAVEAQGRLEQVVLFEGTPPVPPCDGRIEWQKNFFNTGFVVDEESGAIDYRSRAAEISLAAGDLIGEVRDPAPGQEGVNVFGKPIQPAAPKPLRLSPGKNVRLDAASKRLYATSPGRFRVSGRKIMVDSVFTVQGNVGLESGNIDHPGALIVMGDIEAGMAVKAEGDIEVRGVVEAAQIETPGNLMVLGGIIGQEKAQLTIGGDIHARFIHEAQVRVRGNVCIEREIMNAHVVCGGAIEIPNGTVFGGKVTTLGGLRARVIGSDGMVPTTVEVGVDPFLSGDVTTIEKEIEQLHGHLQKMDATVKPFLGKLDRQPAARIEAIRNVIEQADQMRRALQEREETIDERRAQSNARRKWRVQVQQVIHPEVTFTMGHDTKHVSDLVSGPVTASYHEGRIRFVRK